MHTHQQFPTPLILIQATSMVEDAIIFDHFNILQFRN
jgi:hypothetical protein